MKKIAVILILLAVALCAIPCYADEAVGSDDALLISPAPEAADEQLTDTADSESNTAIEFHPESFISSLSYMGTGMIGIFIVIGLIILATVLLNKAFSDKAKKSE